MTIERELKFHLSDRSALTDRLAELGAKLVHPESFEDNSVWDRAGELETGGRLLRLRTDARGGRLTYKGVATFDEGVKSRRELETSVGDATIAAQLLTALGYRVAVRYQKYRESWKLDGVSVELDRTPMGDFVEFEGEGAANAAAACGFEACEALAESYLTLWRSFRAQSPESGRDMVFEESVHDDREEA